MLAALIVLLLLLITSCSVTIWSVFFRDTTPTIAPDYAPQEIEPNATPTPEEDQDDEKLEQSQGGGSVTIAYTKDVTIDLSDKMIALNFTNPTRSNQDMIVQLFIHGSVVAQTKRLPPGYELRKLELLNSANLSAGGYEGKFVVSYYNDDGEKAVVKTEIPLTVKVQE